MKKNGDTSSKLENSPTPVVDISVQKQARLETVFFVIVVYGLNIILLNSMRLFSFSPAMVGFLSTGGIFLQMWIPGLFSLLFRVVFRRGFRDIGWKVGEKRYWLLSILISLSVPTISYLLSFLFFHASLSLESITSIVYQDPLKLISLAWPIGFPHSTITDLALHSIAVMTVGLAVSFILAFGEELGWRGYLQQRIIESRFRFPYALCGLIWAGWHFPFLWYFYNPTTTMGMQGFLFTLNITCLGVIMGRMREDSGSIWIPTLVHAAHNSINFELFAAVIVCRNCEIMVGENGLLMGIIYGIIALFLNWRLAQRKRATFS
jgi:membrane protease YdiL (CAAX protease family)